MSFSARVKEELVDAYSNSRHCQIAEIAAILEFCGKVVKTDDGISIKIQTENKSVIRKSFTLLKKAFNIYSSVLVRQGVPGKSLTYNLEVSSPKAVSDILHSLKRSENNHNVLLGDSKTSSILLKNSCCKRAFLRGVYLASGSMSDPKKSYHLEFVCLNEEQAEQIINILSDFSLDAKMILRKKYFVVYIKEGEGIANLLNIIEAHVALMEFENYRILKEVRNSVNRRVNCEAANITKTVNAAARQIEDILYIREYQGLVSLPEPLRETAEMRLNYPEASLNELGGMLHPPVGKSGVNHRLRKLTEIAEKLRVQ